MKYSVFSAFLLLHVFTADAQKDTASAVKKFEKIMAFNNRPILYYTADVVITSSPVIDETDNAHYTAALFKEKNKAYYRGGDEEFYAEDSILYKINSTRKSVWISNSGREFIAGLTQKSEIESVKQITSDLADVSEDESGSAGKIRLISKPSALNPGVTGEIEVSYDKKTYLPLSISITYTLKQAAESEFMEALKQQVSDPDKLLTVINGEKFFIRSQKMKVDFGTIETGEIKNEFPDIKTGGDAIVSANGVYKGTGIYADYEITKLY